MYFYFSYLQWITSFNPNYKDREAGSLKATYTVDFSEHQEMFDSFYDAWYGKDTRLGLDDKTHIVKFEFK